MSFFLVCTPKDFPLILKKKYMRLEYQVILQEELEHQAAGGAEASGLPPRWCHPCTMLGQRRPRHSVNY